MGIEPKHISMTHIWGYMTGLKISEFIGCHYYLINLPFEGLAILGRAIELAETVVADLMLFGDQVF